MKKTTSEKLLEYYGEGKAPYGAILYKEGKVKDYDGITTISKDMFETQNPDVMDNNLFWKLTTEKSLGQSIIGRPDLTDKNEIKLTSTTYCHLKSALPNYFIGTLLRNEPRNVNMLEIGPGLGNILDLVNKKCRKIEWYGVDVNLLFEHPNLYKGDGYTIPDEIPELEYVYSMNVFQHLSLKQRLSYYNQIYDKLNTGGYFLFGMFIVVDKTENLMIDEDKGIRLFGVKDEYGNYITHFFSQFTIVERQNEVIETLEAIGFVVEFKHINNNYGTFICRKPYLTIE